MADRQPLFVNATGLPEEMADDDSLDLGGLTMSGDIAMANNEVTGLPASPSGPTAAVSSAYIDSVIAAQPPRESCRLATTAALSTWVAAGSGVGKTLTSPDNLVANNDFDGVTAALNDRILVKNGGPNATPAIDNGIYTVTQLATGSAPTILTRATDLDEDDEMFEGVTVWVNEGTDHQNQRWTIYSNDPLTVDTSANEWTQTGGTGLFTGGDGIDITGSAISVDLATNPGLEFDGGSPNKLRVKEYNGITRDANGIGVDAHNGITVDANGVSVNAGSGLVANAGPGDLDIDLATGAVIQPGLQFGTGADLDKLAVLPDPAGAIDVLAAGLHVITDDTTIQINGSNELEVIGAGDANRVSREVTCFENVSAGDPVHWGGADNQVRESQAGTTGRKKVNGVMEDTVTAINQGTMVQRGRCAGVLSGATRGDLYYCAAGGGLSAANTPPTGGQNWVVLVGEAQSADDLDVRIQYIVVKKA